MEDPLLQALDGAPFDDEPDDDGHDGGLSETRRAADEGRGITTSDLRRELIGGPEGLLETLEILADPELSKSIRHGLAEIESGEVVSHEALWHEQDDPVRG